MTAAAAGACAKLREASWEPCFRAATPLCSWCVPLKAHPHANGLISLSQSGILCCGAAHSRGGRYEKFDVLVGPTSDLGQSTEGALGNGCVMSDTALCCSFLKTQHSGMQLEPQ